MAYEQKIINELAKKYKKTESDIIFEELLIKLIPLIRIQLGRQYSSMKGQGFWDDMQQDVLLKIWENRKSLKNSLTKNPYQYFYRRIQDYLNRSCGRIVGQYDSFNPNMISTEDIEGGI